jgi:putative phosphoesterase
LIIDTLSQFAPTFAVRGNCDEEIDFPLYFKGVYAGKNILMYHGHISVEESIFKPDIIITGHSHRPLIEDDKRVLRINPGSAGPKRFKLPVTVARLTLANDKVDVRIIDLPV